MPLSEYAWVMLDQCTSMGLVQGAPPRDLEKNQKTQKIY
jgi:hypothetical protein